MDKPGRPLVDISDSFENVCNQAEVVCQKAQATLDRVNSMLDQVQQSTWWVAIMQKQ